MAVLGAACAGSKPKQVLATASAPPPGSLEDVAMAVSPCSDSLINRIAVSTSCRAVLWRRPSAISDDCSASTSSSSTWPPIRKTKLARTARCSAAIPAACSASSGGARCGSRARSLSIFSTIIYYWAIAVALPTHRIEEMIGDVVLPEEGGIAATDEPMTRAGEPLSREDEPLTRDV